MTYYYYKDNRGEWRWYLQANNGKTIADSGEGYVNQADCLHAIDLVRDTNRRTPVEHDTTK